MGEINDITKRGVNASAEESKIRIREGGHDIQDQQADKFKGTQAKIKHDGSKRVHEIEGSTADAGARTVSAANSQAVKDAIAQATAEVNAWHGAEFEMQNAAKIATGTAQTSVQMWRKAIEMANAGKTFAVDAQKEARKATAEAEETVHEVHGSLEHAKLNTQATDIAHLNATAARDAAASAKTLAQTVHAQVNKTRAGIAQANKDLDTILYDTGFAANEAAKAFEFARTVKGSAPKPSADEDAAPPPAAKDSEDA